MTTDLHTKKTDKHQFLSPKSCHPNHCSRSIPFSQAIRVKRICSTERLQNHRLGELRKQLLNRGYKNNNITESFEKVKSINRDSLLEYKGKNKIQRIPLVVTYHPDLKHLSSVIRKHWHLIEQDPTLKKLLPEPPVMAYRRPKSLRDILVRATIKKDSPENPGGGYTPCRRVTSNCMCCKAANTSSTFQSSVTKQKYKIYCKTSCKTSNCIYLLTCGTCNIQYVGQTQTPFNERLNKHRSCDTTNKNVPVTRHLRSTGHAFSNIKFQIIEQNSAWDTPTRERRENFWMHQLRTLEPNGLNERDQKNF